MRRDVGPGTGFVLTLLVLLALAVADWAMPAGGDAEPLVVTARLVEIPSKFPPDDLYDYAYVMRYEVVGGPQDGSSLLVAHYKPREPRSRIKDRMKDYVSGSLRTFTVGDVHKMKLTPDLKKIYKGPLIDDFAATDRKSVRYWCLQVDPA
jgi:hypothetical protein